MNMNGSIPVRGEHWPEPPRQYQAIAIIAFLLIILLVMLF
jgi:hypothetical protein